jgi:hypothetical protein
LHTPAEEYADAMFSNQVLPYGLPFLFCHLYHEEFELQICHLNE